MCLLFVVDTSEAGMGEFDIEVSCNGQRVASKRTPLDVHRTRYSFTPSVAMEHTVDIAYNYQKIPG